MKTEKILVVDINYLPAEYQLIPTDDLIKKLEEEYGYKFFLTDRSRYNLEGQANTTYPPIYFLK